MTIAVPTSHEGTGVAPRRLATPRRVLWRVLKVAVFAAATYHFALPQLPHVWRAIDTLGDRSVLIPAAGAAFAGAALLAYAQVTRSLLADGDRPGLWHTLGIVVAALGVNRVMPAGNAAGTFVTFRLLGRAGIERGRAAFAMATQGVGSALVLTAMLWISMLLALPYHGFHAGYVAASVVGTALIALTAALLDGLLRRRAWLWALVGAIALVAPVRHRPRVTAALDGQALQLRQLVGNRRTVRMAGAWALANWLFDAAALWMFLQAFGVSASPSTVVLVFALANVVALLPLTPGGLGVVELTMTATLTKLGAPLVPSTLGVAAYRVCNYWLPIPLSAVAYLAIRRIRPARATLAEPVATAGPTS